MTSINYDSIARIYDNYATASYYLEYYNENGNFKKETLKDDISIYRRRSV